MLDGFRCSAHVRAAMNSSAVTIVGGGIIGLATAYQLVRRFPGKRVVILEKEDRVARCWSVQEAMTNPQPQPPEIPLGAPPSETIRELRRSGLTVGDIARLFRVHPKVVASILSPEHRWRRHAISSLW